MTTDTYVQLPELSLYEMMEALRTLGRKFRKFPPLVLAALEKLNHQVYKLGRDVVERFRKGFNELHGSVSMKAGDYRLLETMDIRVPWWREALAPLLEMVTDEDLKAFGVELAEGFAKKNNVKMSPAKLEALFDKIKNNTIHPAEIGALGYEALTVAWEIDSRTEKGYLRTSARETIASNFNLVDDVEKGWALVQKIGWRDFSNAHRGAGAENNWVPMSILERVWREELENYGSAKSNR